MAPVVAILPTTWPSSRLGPFTLTSSLRVSHGVAGTYTVRVDGQAPVSHRIEADSCRFSCTVTSALTTTPVPAFSTQIGTPTNTVRAVLTLDDGTTRTRTHTISVARPREAWLTVPTSDKGDQEPKGTHTAAPAVHYDRRTTVRLNQYQVPDSLFQPAHAFAVRALATVPVEPGEPAAHTVLWERTVLAQGPSEKRFADVVIDPAGSGGPPSRLEWAALAAPLGVGDAGAAGEYLTSGRSRSIGLIYRTAGVTWDDDIKATARVEDARPSAIFTLRMPVTFNRWVGGVRVDIVERREHAGKVTSRKLVGIVYPRGFYLDRGEDMSVASGPLAPYQSPGPGKYTYTWQVYTDDGLPFGDPLVQHQTVLAPTLTVKAPTLVVGRQATATATVTYPWGPNLTQCYFGLWHNSDAKSGGSGAVDLCPRTASQPVSTTRTGTFTFYPQEAGSHRWWTQVRQTPTSGVVDTATLPVVVHAERIVTVAVPDAPLGASTAATVTVKDRRSTLTDPAGVAGEKVTLQRRPVGTSAWTTVGTYTTGTGGVVKVPLTVAATPLQWRASSANGAGTWTSPVDGSRALATLVWSGAPTSAAKGRTTTFSVVVTPAEPGSVVHLQVKAPGATAWSTVVKKAVPNTSTSPAKSSTVAFATSFAKVGTWQVRTVRPASSVYGQGVSSVRQVAVK